MALQVAAIGEGNLLLSCLKDLKTPDFNVAAVFSDSEQVTAYCEEKHISVYPRRASITELAGACHLDYLFSISNPRILKEKEILLPRRLAINYHDSPLPAYSGVNATCWAIMQGEKTHGISWHVIETGIDTGHILRSETLEIDDQDTAFTLNLKCQEASEKSFRRLLQDILNSDITSIPQDLSKRSYYGLYKLLPSLGVLSFNLPCDTLYNFVRSVELGRNENQLGSAKVRTASGVFLLVKTAERSLNGQHSSLPGTILDVMDEEVVVATATAPIHLCLAHLDGSPIPEKQFKHIRLVTGLVLQSNFTTADNDHLVNIRKKERFWTKILKAYEPLTFFRQKMNVLANILDVSATTNLQRTRICNIDVGTDLMHLQAAFLGFLARVCCVADVNVGFIADKTDIPENCKTLYTDICPCLFHVNLSSRIEAAIEKILRDLKGLNLNKPFMKDVLYRYPDVQVNRYPFHNLVIGQQSSHLPDDVFHDCNIVVLFPEHGDKERYLTAVYNKKPGQDHLQIIDTLKHFPSFLSSVSASSESNVSDVSLVSEEEVQKLYTPVEVLPSQATSIVEEFENQCRKRPSAIALKSSKQFLSYQKCSKEVTHLSKLLNNNLEHTLNQLKLIAIHLPNSISYVLSVLATLKSGFSFLPLPVDIPSDRVMFTLSDCNAQMMLTSKELYDSKSFESLKNISTVIFKTKLAGNPILLISLKMNENRDILTENTNHSFYVGDGNRSLPKSATSVEDPCYVIYTSGSTGQPKGVLVKESSVLNMVLAQIDKWDLGPYDVTAQFASIGFDASISEIFTSLLSGGTLAVLNKDQRLGHELVNTVTMLGVTTITLTPSVLNIYSPSDLPTVRNIIAAGEACTLNIAMKWTKQTGNRFFNAYGPTETTVCATIYEFQSTNHFEEVNQDLPIGPSISGCHVYLFDDFVKPVPPGTVGQMYIGGLGVSGGYIGHAADRNPESFLQNPHTNTPDLLYKTGDHAFQDIDGNITFVGRLDDQVKIRGQRIDLSEIEQVLIQHIMVQVAVVVIHKCSVTKESVLSAFVTPDFVFLSELREYLATVLPKYMIPTYIKKLKNQEFPTTLNGKIDRKALSMDESVHDQYPRIGYSHLNEVQLQIARLWCEVLNLDAFFTYSLHRMSSFSEMGGNSLHLVLLQRAIEERMNISLSFTDIGAADTVEAFADIISRKREIVKTNQGMPRRQSDQLNTYIMSDSQLEIDASSNTVLGVTLGPKCSPSFHGKKSPMTILISGVTGFLGAFLLSELLEHTLGNICCMVRETTEVKGLGRVVENMRKYNLWKFEYGNRIAIVLSDLRQEKLGIAPDIYSSLTNDVDAIFLNAAMMNFNGSYEDHRIANVVSTQEFIKFAVTNKRKYLFMTSSLSVFLFPTPGLSEPVHSAILESDFFHEPVDVEGGYGQSKWASERLVLQALEFLPGGAIFRPARVSGTSTDGVGSWNDLFASTLIGMRKLGSHPDMDFPFDLTPVDFCAKAIVEIACKIRIGEGQGLRVFHLFNQDTIPFRELFQGMGLTALPLERWREELRSAPEDNIELLPLTPFFMSAFWDRARHWPVFDTTNTELLISESTRQLLRPTRDLLKTYLRFFNIE
ncbi:linear gramicidin synthase subunit D-like [Haliotis rufescens]|uniref:linear gramicidin synthase subunit D-like n=1 Tax=Haliotis rufescens TaxID=6454 RepID=UPI00201FB19E|nr:linear gramicidin synthase subunit D-like [Haliotis rufescens]